MIKKGFIALYPKATSVDLRQVKNTITLLRFPFSLFLLPISLFSFYHIQPAMDHTLFLVFIIWHLLVYPSSNGYNSYHDQDEGPIGGLAAPPKPSRLLLRVADIMDISALLLSLSISPAFFFCVLVCIVFSRLYSNRKVRIKQYPVAGFVCVFVLQGAWVFCANIVAFSGYSLFSKLPVIYSAIACSFFIGTIYPLTQIYQHEADKKDGVLTLSMLLGIRGTFVFSALMFSLATLFIYLSFQPLNLMADFWLFMIIMAPSTVYFLYWMTRSFKDAQHVDFRNTMFMLVLSSMLNNLYFLILLLK